MEQSAVLCSRHDGVTDFSVAQIQTRLDTLGPRPALSDLCVSNHLTNLSEEEAKALSVTPGREHWRPDLEKTRPAGVLVPLVERPEGLHLLLTQRTDHLKHHAGQISFPGGRKEDEDSTIVDTALRESEEEIGLNPSLVTILGKLPQYVTISAYAITPVVGVIKPPFDVKADPFEVADIFEVPLSHVLCSANHQRHFRKEVGIRRGFYGIPYGDRFIWGATAGILVNFSRLMSEMVAAEKKETGHV